MKEKLLKVSGLKKYFPVVSGLFRKKIGYIKAVDDIDFTIYKGEVLGMVGESGSGKSTAGRAAIRLIEPTAGKIEFEEKNLLEYNKHALKEIRKKIQIVFQDPFASLNPRKTIADAIGEGLLYHNMVKSISERNEVVATILEKVGLSKEIMERYPHEFSGGQQQRICIGRAIAMNPNLVVCDEAVSALDVSVQAQILNLFSDLRREMNLSYLFISHDLSVIKYLSDRVIVLYLGKIMESASTKELFRNPRHPYTQALFSATPKNHPKEKKNRMILTGEIPSALNPPSGCPFRTRCPYAQEECKLPPPWKKTIDSEGNEHIYRCIL